MRKVSVKNTEKSTFGARRFSIDRAGTIENPHLQGLAEHEIHSPWGAFIYRKGHEAKIADFLPKPEVLHRIRVSGVARGHYLEFGATLRQADDSWSKSRSLYRVEQRSERWISLSHVTELEVPYLYDIDLAASPLLPVLKAQLSMLESYIEGLRKLLDQHLASRD